MLTGPAARASLPLWLITVLGAAGTVVTVWGLHAGASLLGPVLLAFVLAVVVQPLPVWLTGKGVPRGLALAIAVLVADGAVIGVAVAVALSLGQLARLLPEYSAEWADLVDGLRSTLVDLGVGPEEARAALESVDLGRVVSLLGELFTSAANAVGALVLVLATTVFMSVDAAALPARTAAAPGWSAPLTGALSSFARGTRSYVVVTTVFGLLVAAVDASALWLLGVPLPLAWGLLSFVTNYIPNIGFFLGLLPPVLLALLVGGPGLAVLVVVIYVVVNFVLQSLVQPVFVGDAVGLSVTVTFLSVFAWGAVLGPLGAVLAVPLTLLVYALVLGRDPTPHWARTVITRPTDGTQGATPRRRRRSSAAAPSGPHRSGS